jgi:Leucine-rich repeat (LRR) protein
MDTININPVLDLSKEYMRDMPDLSGHIHVTKLKLSWNSFSKLNIEHFPPNVKTLILSHNSIEDIIDEKVIPLSVEKLRINSNGIKEFNGSKLGNLRKLNISNNYIKKFVFPPNVNNVDISNNEIEILPDFPKSLVMMDCSANNLDELPTVNNGLMMLACASNRIRDISNLPNSIKLLEASDNLIRSVYNVPRRIETLKLSNNHISDFDCDLPNSLNELFLDNNKLRRVPKLPALIIVICLQQNMIEEIDDDDIPLYTEYVDISDNHIKKIPQCFKANIREFKCSGNYDKHNEYFNDNNLRKSIDLDDTSYEMSYYDDTSYNSADPDVTELSYLYNKDKDKKKNKRKQENIDFYFPDDDDNDSPYSQLYGPYRDHTPNFNNSRLYNTNSNFNSFKDLDYYKKLHETSNTPATTHWVDSRIKDPYCVSVYNTKKIVL